MLVNPFGMLMMTSHRQYPRGGACECPNFGRVDDVTRAMSKGGGGCVLVVICVKFRANQPLCPT